MKVLNVFWIILSCLGALVPILGIIVISSEGVPFRSDDAIPLFLTFPGYLFGILTSVVLMKKTKKVEPVLLVFSILSFLSIPLWFTIVDAEGLFPAGYYFLIYAALSIFSIALSFLNLKKVNKWAAFRKNQIRMRFTTQIDNTQDIEFSDSEEILD